MMFINGTVRKETMLMWPHYKHILNFIISNLDVDSKNAYNMHRPSSPPLQCWPMRRQQGDVWWGRTPESFIFYNRFQQPASFFWNQNDWTFLAVKLRLNQHFFLQTTPIRFHELWLRLFEKTSCLEVMLVTVDATLKSTLSAVPWIEWLERTIMSGTLNDIPPERFQVSRFETIPPKSRPGKPPECLGKMNPIWRIFFKWVGSTTN